MKYYKGDLVEWVTETKLQGIVVRVEGEYDEFNGEHLKQGKLVVKMTQGKYGHTRFQRYGEHCISANIITRVIKRTSILDDELFIL